MWRKFWPYRPTMNVGTSRSEAITVSRFITSFWSFAILRLEVVAHAAERVARGLERFGRAQQLVVGVAERDLDVAREQLAVVELDAVVDDLAHRVARRGERAADAAAGRGGGRAAARPTSLHRPGLDHVLELVDLVVEVVDRSRKRSAITSTRW